MVNTSDWPVEKLWANPDNPRQSIKDQPDFEGLVASIKSQGIIVPLLINNEGMILAGHRRHEAALAAGLCFVPVRVLGDDQCNHDLIPLIENLQRSDLTVLEVAEYLNTYSREHDATLVQIAEVTGISTSTIGKYIKLANAPVKLKERIARDEIPLTAAFELLRYDDKFIHEVALTPKLTKQIIREKAESAGVAPLRPNQPLRSVKCPTEIIPHLKYAIQAVEELLAASPSDCFSSRYKRWIVIMQDDLADMEVEPTFEGTIDVFQRQPTGKASLGWKAS